MAGFDFGAPRIRPLGRQFAQTRVDPRVNNGTHTGGLAFALQNALAGYERGQERRRVEDDQQAYTDAQTALTRGLMGQPGDAPLPEGMQGPVRPPEPGGLEGAASELAALEGNPYAGRLASQLMMTRAQQEAEAQREMEMYQRTRADRIEDRDADFALRRQLAQHNASLRPQPQAPAAIQEWNAFSSMSPDQQRQYLMMKRANPYLNLGDVMAQPDPIAPGQIMGQMGVGIEPERTIQDGRIVTMPGISGGPRGGAQDAGIGGTNMTGADRRAARTGGVPSSLPYDIEELPKSAADVEKERLRQQNRARAGGTVIQDINRALGMVQENPGFTTGFGAQALRSIPMTDAKTVQGHIDSALSNVGLDTLQAMREASPTGGALGQVPIQQQQRLEQVLGSLDPTQRPEVVEDNLKRVSNIYMDIVYGTPDEIAQQVQSGAISAQEAQAIMQRKALTFDEFGRPAQGRGATKGGTPQTPSPTAPQRLRFNPQTGDFE